MCFFFNDTATTEIYTYCHTLSLHDALPILRFAEIGGQRPPEARLDPPRRLLPIMPVIVAQTVLIGRGHPDRGQAFGERPVRAHLAVGEDRKSTRLNSSH